MKFDVIVAEVGSTTTVVNAFNGIFDGEPCFAAQGQAPTSVLEGDVNIGLKGALEDLRAKNGYDTIEYDDLLAASSAAGGLRMTVHGLVYEMTAKAAKEAALGAGAIIKYITAGQISEEDLEKIDEENPNIMLLAGGVDYGETKTAIYNAQMLKRVKNHAPVIYGGNIECREKIEEIFEGSNHELYIVDNVYPKIGLINVEPCRDIIQQAFEDNIVKAPGMGKVRDLVSGNIIPTPGAVMKAAQLLNEEIGDLMVIDVGGATTDIHAVTLGDLNVDVGEQAPEPRAKRTVEGDLGVFVNRFKVIDMIGEDALREELALKGIDYDQTISTYAAIPKNESEFRLVERLTLEAVIRAVKRHAGLIKYVHRGGGPDEKYASGKDLTKIQYIIGTGGALTRLPARIEIMQAIAKQNSANQMLFPTESAQILVDNDYIMASCGVLSTKYPKSALRLMEKSLRVDFNLLEKSQVLELLKAKKRNDL